MPCPQIIDKTQNAEQIIANLSHELKTPLINLLGGLEQIERSCPLLELKPSVGTMKENIWRLMNTVDKVLTLSRIKNETWLVSPGNCSLKAILQEIIPPLQAKADQKGVRLCVHVEDSLPDSIYLDGQILREVLFHLLDNAVKFTSKGKINLLVEPSGSNLKVHVIDTGIGITQSVGEHLFECYYQSDISFSRQYEGIGIGLFICRELLQLVNGKIWWESIPHNGSCLVFEIPYQPAKNDIKRPKNTPEHTSVFLQPPRLLLAEDHMENQYLMRDMLERYGFEVILAANGLEALQLLYKIPVDLVLMDMQMPIMDGYEATGMIRQCRDWDNLPIIAVTAHNNPGDRKRCLDCGCNQYVAKPFKIEELVDSICTLLNAPVPEKPLETPEGLIETLMPQFIIGLKKNIGELEHASKEADYAAIKKIGHAIKGTAGLYKQSYIAVLGRKIEQYGKDQASLLPQIILILKNACSHLEKKYTSQENQEAASNL